MSEGDRDLPRSQRPGLQGRGGSGQRGEQSELRAATDRELHYESPTKYDIDYYQRKVNRLEGEVSSLQQELSLHKYRLQKAQDFQAKYEALFAQNQNTNQELQSCRGSLQHKITEAKQTRANLDRTILQVKSLESELDKSKKIANQTKGRNQEEKTKASTQEKENLSLAQKKYLSQIDNIKSQAKNKEDKLIKQLNQAKFLIESQSNTEVTQKTKLDWIKNQKNQEINRLKETLLSIKKQLSDNNQRNDERLNFNRTQLIDETEKRVSHLRNLASDVEAILTEEIKNLNDVIVKKDQEIEFLLQCDKAQIQQNQRTQNDLKAHIRRLQDKIFIIQRENELQTFKVIERLQAQYKENIQQLNRNYDLIAGGFKDKENDLNAKIKALERQLEAMTKEAKNWEREHKNIAQDRETTVKMLSQRIIGLEKLKDEDLKNYTVSMRQIEDDAKTKLDDLHSAIESKKTEFEILNKQMALKNGQINHLIDQIDKLRNENREKMRKLQTTNYMQQTALSDLITNCKKELLDLKIKNNELESTMTDVAAQAKLKNDLMREELNMAKEANALLSSRNAFLTDWCKELESDLKKERISNVDILHDQTVTRRETVQVREQVKVELEAIKDREVQQIKNIFKLEKGRLETDLINKEQQNGKLKAENNRLLVEYKNLERKLGKPSKIDKGAQQDGKCRATLDAEIKLTENIFNAINKF